MKAQMRSSFRLAPLLILALAALPLLWWNFGKEASPPPAGPSWSPSKGVAFSARVAGAIDGDTFKLADGERVRLLGIDAPEKDSPLYGEARDAARSLSERRELRLEVVSNPSRDRYGRLLALVWAGEILLNREIVARGLALVYLKSPGDLPKDVEKSLIEAQNLAMDRRLGLWGRPGSLSARTGEVLVATRYRFHRADCPALSQEDSKVRTAATTREAAFRAGKSPCRTCKP